MRLKLARNCLLNTMMGKSLRETGEQHREVCFRLVLSRGFLPAEGVYNRVLEAHGHTLGKLLLDWHSSHTNLGSGEMSLCVVTRNVTCWCEMLCAGVKGSCLHRPENWLMRQLIDLRDKAGAQNRIY
jgi:hypothetical protein